MKYWCLLILGDTVHSNKKENFNSLKDNTDFDHGTICVQLLEALIVKKWLLLLVLKGNENSAQL